MDLGPEQIRWIVTYMIILIASVAFHEFGHAFVADRLGYDTPSRQGRVTLNPLAHADPIGTVALPLMTSIFGSMASGGFAGGFGWGRPVQTTPARYTRRFSMATGQVFVAIAGPMMNVLLAVLVATVHVILLRTQTITTSAAISTALFAAVGINFSLFFFNLIPIPPLDGGWVARRFVSRRHAATYESIAAYGPFIIMAFVMIPVLSVVIRVPASFCMEHLYRVLAALVGL
jgi:Zn-dependent protease